jgi:hypothetical protein
MSEEDPNQEQWATAKVVETTEEAVVVAGFLDSIGVRAEVESLRSSELPVDVGALGEVRVRVPHEQLEEALAALSSREGKAPLDGPDDDLDPPAGDTDDR